MTSCEVSAQQADGLYPPGDCCQKKIKDFVDKAEELHRSRSDVGGRMRSGAEQELLLALSDLSLDSMTLQEAARMVSNTTPLTFYAVTESLALRLAEASCMPLHPRSSGETAASRLDSGLWVCAPLYEPTVVKVVPGFVIHSTVEVEDLDDYVDNCGKPLKPADPLAYLEIEVRDRLNRRLTKQVFTPLGQDFSFEFTTPSSVTSYPLVLKTYSGDYRSAEDLAHDDRRLTRTLRIEAFSGTCPSLAILVQHPNLDPALADPPLAPGQATTYGQLTTFMGIQSSDPALEGLLVTEHVLPPRDISAGDFRSPDPLWDLIREKRTVFRIGHRCYPDFHGTPDPPLSFRDDHRVASRIYALTDESFFSSYTRLQYYRTGSNECRSKFLISRTFRRVAGQRVEVPTSKEFYSE
jgi:hypothetical protein